MVTKINDHVQQAIARLPAQFSESDLLHGLITGIGNQVQDIEDAAYDQQFILDIDTMVGAQLDLIGSIVGLQREARSDAEYRVDLNSQIAINQGSGSDSDIYRALEFFTGATDIEIRESFPAKIEYYVDTPDDLTDVDVLVAGVVAAGVGAFILYDWIWSDGSTATLNGDDAYLVSDEVL